MSFFGSILLLLMSVSIGLLYCTYDRGPIFFIILADEAWQTSKVMTDSAQAPLSEVSSILEVKRKGPS